MTELLGNRPDDDRLQPDVLSLRHHKQPALAGFLAGGAHGFLYPALSALLVDVTPENRRARAVGTFSSVFLLGNAVGVSPLVILGSLAFWGLLWGIPGMFLAVPLTVVAILVMDHFEQTRPVARLLKGG